MNQEFTAPAGVRSATYDCVPRALSLATNIPYLELLPKIAFAKTGKNKGYYTLDIMAQKRRVFPNHEFTLLARSGTVDKLIRNFPNERIIVRIRQHLTFIDHGRVKDLTPVRPKQRVRQAWLVTNKI